MRRTLAIGIQYEGQMTLDSGVRTGHSRYLPHDKSAQHSGALQMTGVPAYNWYVSNQYLDTRDTGYRDSRNVCFWLASPPPLPPGLSRSFLVRCSSINYYPRILPHPSYPLSGHPPAQLCLPMRLSLTRWHSEQTPLVGESHSYGSKVDMNIDSIICVMIIT